jgi:protease-4
MSEHSEPEAGGSEPRQPAADWPRPPAPDWPRPPMPPRQPIAPPPPRRSGGGFKAVAIGCAVAVFAVFAAFGLILIALIVLVGASIMGGGAYSAAATDGVPLQEVSVSGQAGDPKIALVPVRGILLPGATLGPDPARVFQAMLDQAANDDRVRAVVLLVDSPGGGITTCDVMLKHLRDFKADARRPVVALLEDVAASGGYYVSCGADRIMAHPTTTTGSIGVMIPLYDVSGLMKRFGVADRTVTSGEFKDMGSPFALKTEEEREREREIFQELVMNMHRQFVDVVARGRDMSEEEAGKLADGRVYTSGQAEANGLVDVIGYQDDAVELAKELAGLRRAHVVRYARARSLTEMLLMDQSVGRSRSGMDALTELLASTRLLYLWCPQVGMPAE